MPTRTDWSRVQRESRLQHWQREAVPVRVRNPRQLACIPKWQRLFADGHHAASLQSAVAAYWRNRPTS